MKDTLRTILVGTLFTVVMILSLVLIIPVPLFKLPFLKKVYNSYTHIFTSTWGKVCFMINNTRTHVAGTENLPKHKNIIYIANHQGYCDIPLVLAYMPTTVGFIAKKELKKAPIFGIWMMMLHCIFIDRTNFRKSMKGIELGIKEAKDGYPKVIFPEGTRSKSAEIGNFKPGSILLAAKAGLTIVPLTINNTYKIWEEHNKIKKANLFLTIHPSIETSSLSETEKKELPSKLWKIIKSALPNS